MKRGLLIGGGVLLVLIAAAIFYLYSSLDSLIKTAVETLGSDITRTRITLKEVKISPASGELTGAAQKAVASLGIGGAVDKLTKGVTGGAVEETLKGASDAIEKGVEGIGKSLKGLFGK